MKTKWVYTLPRGNGIYSPGDDVPAEYAERYPAACTLVEVADEAPVKKSKSAEEDGD